MIRVFIADDHGVVRAGLRTLLTADPGIEVVGESADGSEVVEFVRDARNMLDVLILDLALKGLHGIDVLKRCIALRPRLSVIVHSMYGEAQYADWVKAEGAAAYVCKDLSEECIVDAVRSVATAKAYAPRRQAAVAAGPARGHHLLTARELQVFMMLASGQSVSEVAHELGLGLSTVSTHVGKIRQTLGAKTVGEIVAYAHRHGLVS